MLENEECAVKQNGVSICDRYLLNIYEAATYYHIGEKKIRSLINEYQNNDFVLFVGNKVLIKKNKFERFLESVTSI